MRNPRDFWAGLMYLALGVAVLVLGRGYEMGSSSRMGPGYFPNVLGAILAILGIISVGRSFIRPGEAISALAWKPMLLVLGSTVLFGALLQPLGLLVALPAMIVGGALASRHTRLDVVSVAALVGIVAFCALVFVKGLGVPMPLVGTWLGG